jgi:stearoyl-CoA desaturase (delta-9 desaturase)
MTKPPVLWLNVTFFSVTSLAAIILTPLYFYFFELTWVHLLVLVLAVGFSGISITAGYHRLWAHRTYQAHPILQVIFAFGGAFAIQNSALHWSSDHRDHHKYVDHDGDPYAAPKGFWFSHIGWMLRDYQGEQYSNYNNVRDLQQNPIVAWQHRHYLSLVLLMNLGVPLLLGIVLNDLWGMLLFAGLLRLIICQHSTFFINSLAHIWGTRPYSVKNTARDNHLLALLTFGEGYHNFHHHFASDYRNGVKWWQFDPTKWLIWSLSKIKLANNLKTTSEEAIERARAETLYLKTKARLTSAHPQLTKLQQQYELLIHDLQHYYKVRRRLLMLRKQKVMQQYDALEITEQCKALKETFTKTKHNWLKLNRALLKQTAS